MVTAIFPSRYEENIIRALDSVTVLLVRYFTGILAESFILMIVVSTILLIFGATILVGLLKESNFLLRYAYLVMNSRLVQGSPLRLFLLFSLLPQDSGRPQFLRQRKA